MTVGWFNLKVYAFDVIGFDYVFAFKPEIYGAFSRLQTLCLMKHHNKYDCCAVAQS